MEDIELKETLNRIENKLDTVLSIFQPVSEVERTADEKNIFLLCQSTPCTNRTTYMNDEGEDEPHGI